MIRIPRFVLLLVISISVVDAAFAQVQTGMPQFASFGGGPDVIDLANLNVHYTIPIRNKPGRGTPFVYNLDYDSSIWTPQPSSPKLWVQPPEYTAVFYPWNWQGLVPAGQSYITYSMSYSTGQCGQGGNSTYQEWQFSGITYVDLLGNSYSFSTTLVYFNSPGGNCPPNGPQPPTPQPVSSGGYTLYALAGAGSLSTAYVVDSTGTTYYPPVLSNPPAHQLPLTTTDRNGNQITSSSGSYTDTLGRTALGVVQNGSTGVTLSYAAPNGGTASYAATYKTYSVKTNFGCSGIVDWGPQNIALMDQITLPDGSYYKFGYELTAGGSSGQVTGRIASVQFPTGGTISYTYQTNNSQYNGITCADGSAIGLTRTMPDGSKWTYARTPGSGNAYTTKVTDPLGNDTVIQFQGIYETQRQVYSGSSGSGTLLESRTTCYNGNTTNCTGTAVSSAITQRNVTNQFGSTGLQCLRIYKYTIPSTGAASQLSEEDDYDYASGTPTTILRKVFITYASLGSITNMPATVSTCTATGNNSSCGGAGTLVAQTMYTYDQGTPSTSSGTPQHVSVSGSRGNPTTIAYLTQGSATISKTLTYYDTGMVKTIIDVNTAVTTLNYPNATSTCGNAFPTSISEPLSMSGSMTWNCSGGVLTSVTDENSQVTTSTYSDADFWRPASVSFPDGGQTGWTYNSPTSTTTTTKINSSQNTVSTVILDGLGRTSQTQLNDPEGTDYSVMTYDALGRPYKVYNPTRCNPPTTNCGTESTWGYTTTAYDSLNRPTSVTLQDGSVASALYSNNTVTTTDPAGKTRQSMFDALGGLTQVIEDPGTSPHLNYVTSYTFDALGNLTNVTQNGGRQRTFAYDAISRLTTETNPEAGTITYKYDSDSNCASPNSSTGDLISRTDARNIRACFQYDTLHRLTQKNYSNGTTPTAYFAYDMTSAWGTTLTNPKRRLTELWTGTPSTATTGTIFGYDAMGRITINNQLTPLGTSYPVGYTYDLIGDTTSTNYLSGFTISQTYDAASRPASVTSSVSDSNHPGTLATVDSSVGYYPPGALRKMTFGNNLTETTALNNALEPCRINWNSSGTALGSCTDATPSGNLQDFSYGFNAGSANNGNIASWSGTGQQAFTRTFGYDSLNRLYTLQETNGVAEGCKPSSSPSNPYNITWGYDAWGNRTSQSPSGGTCSFSQNVNTQNQLSSPYQYDAAGNLINDGNHAYFYDAENRLVQVDGTLSNCSTATACYVYGASGSRIEKIMGSNQVHYFRDLAGNVLVEKDQNANWLADYIYQSGQLLAEYKSGTTYFVHSDHLGSSRLLTGVNQSVAQNLDYLPFGEILSSDSGTTTHKFTGDERDSETNLDLTWFRQYSSQLGRWPSPDPAGLAAVAPSNPQSWNRYSYVNNNPLSYIDPIGLYPELSCVSYSVSWDDQISGQPSVSGGGEVMWDCEVMDNGIIEINTPLIVPSTIAQIQQQIDAFQQLKEALRVGAYVNCLNQADQRAQQIGMETTRRSDAAMGQVFPSLDWAGVFAVSNGLRSVLIKGSVTGGSLLQGAGIGILAKGFYFTSKAAIISLSGDIQAAWQGMTCSEGPQ